MKKFLRSLILGLSITLTGASHGAEEKFPQLKIGNVIYTNVVVASKSPTDIFILHKGGALNLKLKNLEPELQKQFGFDPEKAEALERKRVEDQAGYQTALAAAAAKKTTPAPPKQIWAKSFLGQKAPEIVVRQWLGAKPETEGKFLLVNFWATSSEPSIKAIPALNKLHQKFGKEVVVIGLTDEPEEKVRAMNQPGIEFFSGIDPESQTLKMAEVRGLPHVLLIDPSGIVRWEGFPSLEGYELTEETVQGLLAKVSK